MVFSVMMQDLESVERVARAINLVLPHKWRQEHVVVHYQDHKKGGRYARISLSGERALAATQLLWPYLKGTAKGEQITRACERAGVRLRV